MNALYTPHTLTHLHFGYANHWNIIFSNYTFCLARCNVHSFIQITCIIITIILWRKTHRGREKCGEIECKTIPNHWISIFCLIWRQYKYSSSAWTKKKSCLFSTLVQKCKSFIHSHTHKRARFCRWTKSRLLLLFHVNYEKKKNPSQLMANGRRWNGCR